MGRGGGGEDLGKDGKGINFKRMCITSSVFL